MLNKIKNSSLFVILLLGLTPLLWFVKDKVVLGHDSGLTLLPLPHFLDRLYAWTDRFSFGVDQTFAIPGFFFHGLEALFSFVGLSLQQNQQAAFIFWFVLPGLTMYYLGRKLEKYFSIQYFALPASVFFMFNHFILQGWFIAERTKFSLYAALPLIFAFLFDWSHKKLSTFKTALYISLTFFFLNGEASIPLFGGIILFFLLFSITYLVNPFTFQKVKSLLLLAFYTTIISILLQSYWLIPFGYYVMHNFSKEVAQAGGLNGILGWVNYISENSSLINLFRLQGIPEWYQNPLHPYAKTMLTSPIFVFLSFLFPFLAFLSLIAIKEKKKIKMVIFLGLLALLSMVFMAGSHQPFGALYIFMIKFVPGFIAFRTPYYKFASSLWFAYSLLIAFSVYFITTLLSKKNKILGKVFYVLFFVFTLVYSYPFFNGGFFEYMVGERSMRVSVPQYVFDFGNWSSSPERIGVKTLSLPQLSPDFRVDAYTWGYWSLAPVTTLLTNAPIITSSGYGSKNANELLDSLYSLIAQNDPRWKEQAKLLGIQSFLLKKDFAWNLKQSTTVKPSVYEKAMHDPELHLVRTFGEWEVYDFDSVKSNNAVTMTSTLNYYVGNAKDFAYVYDLPHTDNQQFVYVNSQDKPSPAEKLVINSYVIPPCVNCNLQYNFSDIVLSAPVINHSSKLYTFVQLMEKYETSKFSMNSYDALRYYLQKTLDDSLSFNKLSNDTKPLKYLALTLDDYQQHLQSFKFAFESQKNVLTNDQLVDIDNILRKQQLLLDVKVGDENLKGMLAGQIKNLNTIKNTVDSNAWETIDQNNKKFLIYIPKNDNYYFKYIPGEADNPSLQNNQYLLDGKGIELLYEDANRFSSNESVYLTKGLHRFQATENYVNRFEGVEEIKTLQKTNECFITNKIKTEPNAIYRIIFDYQTQNKGAQLGLRYISTPKPKEEEKDTIQVASEWKSYQRDYAAANNQSDFILQFCNKSDNSGNNIQIKNISISKISIPKVLLYTDHQNGSATKPVAYKKDDPTHYTVPAYADMTSKILILNNTYSPNWDADNLPHIEINGYANAWILPNDISNKSAITINYQIQRLVQIGFIITSISLIIAAIIIIVLSRKKRYGKNK